MPSLGSGLSLGTLNKLSGFDYDASMYINSASIPATAPLSIYSETYAVTSTQEYSPRKQLNDFILGLKTLGVWDKSYCCSFRTDQNLNNSSNLIAFGGLSTASFLKVGTGAQSQLGTRTFGSGLLSATFPNHFFDNDVSIYIVAGGGGTLLPNYSIKWTLQDYGWIWNGFGCGNNQGQYAGLDSISVQLYPNGQENLNYHGYPSTGTSPSLTTGYFYNGMHTAGNPNPNVPRTGFYPQFASLKTSTTNVAGNGVFNLRGQNLETSDSAPQAIDYPNHTMNLRRLYIGSRRNGVSGEPADSIDNISATYDMHVSFVGIFKPGIHSLATSINTLYKNTLGQGLPYIS